MLLNDLMKQLDEAMEKSTGPKFTGYWKAKDPAPAGKKMVGGESVESNPTDKVTMDIPLFLRMMEYAKEDAKTDMDLHDVTERAIALMKEHEYLCMDNYNDLVGGEATGGEEPMKEDSTEQETFVVHIPANVYGGKYYDYRTVAYQVHKGQDGVETEEDAIDWVNSHKDQILAELDKKRVRVGSRLVRKVAKPVTDNVFFKDRYYVKSSEIKTIKEPMKEAEIEIGVGYAIKLPSGKLAKASNGKTWWHSSPEGANKVNAASFGGEGTVVKVKLENDQYAYNGHAVVEGKKKITAKNDPCWSGYHMVGTKKKNGREVPNCVPGKKGD